MPPGREHASGAASPGRSSPPLTERPIPARSTDIARLQRTVGNRAVADLLAGPGAVQRQPPNASFAPPQASVPPSLPANVFMFGGRLLGPQQSLCRKTLTELLPELGGPGTSSWAYGFINAGWDQQLQLQAKGVSKETFDETKVVLREELLRLEHENLEFLKRFEERALAVTRELLDTGQKQIGAERMRLGLGDGSAGTVQSPEQRAAFVAMQAEARALAAKRAPIEQLLGQVQEDERWWKSQESSPFIDPAHQPRLAAMQKLGQRRKEAEAAFAKDAQAAVGRHPALAAFLSGENVAAQLTQVGASESAATYFTIGHFNEKLKNIATVRAQLGGRFSVWKQPALLATIREDLKANPGQSRLVNDKAKAVAADEKSSQMMWAAIAIGLGLLAAIPTGGTSVLATVAAAAAVAGAGVAVYRAYEATQDYLLASATANSALDRAQAIAKDDPEWMWLALDIAGAALDVVGAGVAFKAAKAAVVASRGKALAERLPALASGLRAAGVAPAVQGRVIARVLLEQGGDVGKALWDLRQVLARTAAAHSSDKLAAVMARVGTRMLDEGRVAVLPGRPALNVRLIKDRLRLAGLAGPELDRRAFKIAAELGTGNTRGMYYPDLKLVFLKGDATAESVASVLIHEATHHRQNVMGMLQTSTIYELEFQAFKAQQRFLELLPADLVPSDSLWLLRADNHAIENHVLTAYVKEGAFKPKGFSNDDVAEAVVEILLHGAK